MGRGRSGSGGGSSGITGGGGGGGAAVTATNQQVHQVATAAQAQVANNSTFPATDAADFHDLYNGRQYYQNQTFGIDTRMAIADYLNDQAVGGMYSPSQNLNYKMRQGLPLTANEEFMRDSLMEGMHNLGYNVNLTRYDRVDSLAQFGLGGGKYQNYSEVQLKQKLVGATYHDRSFTSTSYNNFKNAPSGNSFTDKAVVFRYSAKAHVQALMPGNGPGGALGEMILAPGQQMRITNVKFTTNSSGRRVKGRSGAQQYDRIEIFVEVG